MHRVLWLTETYPPDRGGMSVSCDRIVRGLKREGVQIDVIHLDRTQPDPSHTINLAWNTLHRSHPSHPSHWSHVIAFGGYLPLLAAPIFSSWLDCPLITLIRGNELDAGLFDPRRKPVLDDALRRSTAVCTVTTEHAEKIAALYEITPRVIPNGIDFELWQATDGDRARAALYEKRTFGFFGHLKAKKGVPFFLDALRKSKHDVHLLIVGEGELALDDFPHTRVAALDRFALIPHYLACDFVVLPSHYDGFPNVLIESAALGIPAIASNVGGMKDLPAAILFEPGDEHDCRAAIDRAARMTGDEIRALGANAQQLAHEKCDARDEARRYVELLDDSLLRDRRRPRASGARSPRPHTAWPARSRGDSHGS
jgi:glycosyltransferase involved in cell wall biosynthesis